MNLSSCKEGWNIVFIRLVMCQLNFSYSEDILNRVGISENQPNEKSKALYSEPARAMESSIVSNILAEIQR